MQKFPLIKKEQEEEQSAHDQQHSFDYCQYELKTEHNTVFLTYYHTLINEQDFQELLIKELQNTPFSTLNEIKSHLSIDDIKTSSCDEEITNALLQGNVFLQLDQNDEIGLLVPLFNVIEREISIPEIEFTVIGPKEAFIETLDTNIYLIRKRLPIPDLKIKEITVGSLTKTRIAILYIDSIANDTNVETMIQRTESIDIDQVVDSSILAKLLADNSLSIFPEFLETERPDRVTTSLTEGKVVAIVDGSPQAIIGPSTLIEFFSALEDYFIGWQMSSAIRILRLFAVWFSIFATPLYVAFLTYHVELIPQDLLANLIMSRSVIPFPPILEVLFLEITIELLREAGARLPTKVGQTIGIVGGIVIGTAAVEAGLTSNVLLIIVALAALASFTTPVYRMGNTIRFLRFPFILAAQLWGVISITILFCALLISLLSVKSLGRPYLEPIYPPRIADLKDSFIKMPFSYQATRPFFLQTKQPVRFDEKEAREINDIDEGI